MIQQARAKKREFVMNLVALAQRSIMHKKRLGKEILDYNLPEEMKVPDECQILYIMRRKYVDLVEHFNEQENKQ